MNTPTSTHPEAAPGQGEVLEPAPPNSLPDWSECQLRVENSDFIAKRVAEGGYGDDGDSKLANELHRFIYEYDDADPYRSDWFMHRLEKLIDWVRADALAAPSPAAPVVPQEIERCQCGYPMPCASTVPIGFCRAAAPSQSTQPGEEA